MKTILGAALASLLLAGTAMAQAPAAAPKPFAAGLPLGVTDAQGKYTAMSKNVKVYGAVFSAESCSYDPTRGLIIVPNRNVGQNRAANAAQANDAFVSLLNHDGSVNTPLWIGNTRDGLVLNEPFGSDVANGKLYLADSDGNTTDGAKRVSVVRMFDLKTGAPAGELRSPDVAWFNDIAVDKDGTVYGSQTGGNGVPERIYKVTPDGQTSVFIDGKPLALPNGVAIDNDGNIVVVNITDDAVLTFDKSGKLLKTEHASMPGNDGLVITKDGTKYVSSVRNGGVSKISPGKPSVLIATGIPSPASACYDPGANQLVIPMNANNALSFIKLGK
jgi:hypothetical protein